MQSTAPPFAAPIPAASPADGVRVAPWLWGICVVALLLRVTAIVVLRAWENPNAMEHATIAQFLHAGHGFTFSDWGVIQPTSVQSPLFPFLLYGFFLLFGKDSAMAYAGVMVINAVLGAMTCAVTYGMTRALRGSARTGLIAAALVAVWPTQIYAVTSAQAIAFITLASMAVIWLFYRSIDTGSLGLWIAYGLIGCLGALTEPVLLPFMALSGILILFWKGLPAALRLRNATALFFCSCIVIVPWMMRNYVVHETIMPVKSTFWVNVWKGNNPNATGTDRIALTDEQRAALEAGMTDAQLRDPTFDGLRQYALLTPEQKMELTGKTEVERETIFGRYAKAFIRDNPGRYAELCALRLWKTLFIDTDNPKSHGLKQTLFYRIPRGILLVLTPIALVIAWRRGWRMFIPLLVAGSALLTYTLTIAAARFALPYEPWQLALIAGLFSPFLRSEGRTS